MSPNAILNKFNTTQFNHITRASIEIQGFKEKDVESFRELMGRLAVLKSLVLFIKANEFKIPPDTIPKTVTDLHIIVYYDTGVPYQDQFRFDGSLVPGSIPSSVIQLVVSHYEFIIKHDDLNYKLVPDSVSDLLIQEWTYQIGCTVNIPKSVKKLTIRSKDDKIKLIPGIFGSTTVKDLSLYLYNYTEPLVQGVIPKSVRFFIYYSNAQTLTETIELHSIPNTVRELDIEPKNVEGHELVHGMVPDGVSLLNFYPRFITEGSLLNLQYLPTSLQELFILPLMSEYLNFSGLHLLVNLKVLEGPFKCITIGMLPPNLESLATNGQMELIEKGSLPSTLKKIKFKDCLVGEIQPGTFPESLNEIILHGALHFPPIPSSVTLFYFANYKAPIPSHGLPDSVKLLVIENPGENDLLSSPNILPPNLEILDLSMYFKLNLPIDLPKSLRRIIFPQIDKIDKTTLEKYAQTLIQQFSISDSTLQVNFAYDKLIFTSLDKNDPYLYYQIEEGLSDGFILKSNIHLILFKLFLNKK
eukprot:gene4827-6016_t